MDSKKAALSGHRKALHAIWWPQYRRRLPGALGVELVVIAGVGATAAITSLVRWRFWSDDPAITAREVWAETVPPMVAAAALTAVVHIWRWRHELAEAGAALWAKDQETIAALKERVAAATIPASDHPKVSAGLTVKYQKLTPITERSGATVVLQVFLEAADDLRERAIEMRCSGPVFPELVRVTWIHGVSGGGLYESLDDVVRSVDTEAFVLNLVDVETLNKERRSPIQRLLVRIPSTAPLKAISVTETAVKGPKFVSTRATKQKD